MQRLKRRKDSMREMSQWCSKLIHEGEDHGASEENIHNSPEKPDDIHTVSRIDQASTAPSSISYALLRKKDSDTSEEKLHNAKKPKEMKDHVKEMSQWCGQVIHEDEEHSASEEKNDETPKGSIAETDVKALVDLIFKWSEGGDGVLERATGALANLAADEKCSREVAKVRGIHALVMLAQNCKYEGVQEQAARALANLAAHGDSNSNNSAVGQEEGALNALVQLTRSPYDRVKQEAAGALWNLSFDDRNREAIASAGFIEALVALAHSCSNASPGLQERAAGALWGLSMSEANSIAIGREGGVATLIALARSETEDVHETAAGALWNLAFNPGNALRIVENGGVPALVHICSSSVSKMARFMAALALAYMFDGRMDEFALIETSSESSSKSVSLDGSRRMALTHIEAFIRTFFNRQAFSASAALSSAPGALKQVTNLARIEEAGLLRCSASEIGRFVAMLSNPSSILKSCAAFALLQFTVPGGRHAVHHVQLLQTNAASWVLREVVEAASASLEAKIFASIILQNLKLHQI